MAAPRSTLECDVAQNEILDDLVARLKKVQHGRMIGGRYQCSSTIRTVVEVPDSVASIDDWQLPAAMIFLDGNTSLEPVAGGEKYSARWNLDIALVVRDQSGTDDPKRSKVPRLLAALCLDVIRVLHETTTDPCAAGHYDAGWVVTGWKIEGYDTKVGVGTLGVSIVYNELTG